MTVVRAWRIWLCAALLMLAVSCRVDTTVDVVVLEDGSGTVTVVVELDSDALARLGDPAEEIPTDDLTAAGWNVAEPRTSEAGATIQAEKSFVNPAQFEAIMQELSGAAGPLRDFALRRDTPFARTKWTLSGVIDLSSGLDAFGDQELAELLGEPIGWTTDDLEAELGKPIAEAFGFDLVVELPGSIGGNGTRSDGGAMTWNARIGQDPVDVKATGTTDATAALIWAGVALGAVALLGFVLVVRLLRYMRRDRRDYVDPEPPAGSAASPRDGRAPVVAGEPAERKLEMVVLGGAGVIYEVREVVEKVLYPLARDLGSDAAVQEVEDLFQQTTLGRRTTAEFWQALGLGGDARTYDRDFMLRARLSPDVSQFIDRMRDRDLKVAVVDNDSAHWSTARRRRFHLDDQVDHFVISAEVGAHLPDGSVFETLRRASGVDPADMLYLDAFEANLDAAAELGMATVWFAPPADADIAGRRIVRGFRDFFKQD